MSPAIIAGSGWAFRKRAFAMISLLAMGFVLSSCSPKSKDKIDIGGGPNVSMLVIIAQKQGYFTAEHLNVAFKPLQTSKIAFDAVASSQIDLGVVTDANIALLGYSGLGDIRIVGSVMTKVDDAVVARRGDGVSVPADLKGKRIAYTPASSSEAFLDLFLNRNGLSSHDVTLVPMTPPTMLVALDHADIDAASIWQPFRYNIAKALGEKGLQFENDGVYPAKILLIATANTVAKRPDDLQKLFSALAKAAVFVRANPARSIELVEPEMGIDAATLTATWGEYKFEVGDTKTLATDLRAIASAISMTEPDLQAKPLPDYAGTFAFDAQDRALEAQRQQ